MYLKNKEAFDDRLFENPTSEYRGAPFWAWNCQMTSEKVARIIEIFSKMGMGGCHIHSRAGLNTPYLGDDFMRLVSEANQNLKERGMFTWLYDEDRWPSGFAGGAVTKDRAYRRRGLIFTTKKLEDEWTTPIAHYQVVLEEGWLKDYKRISIEEEVDAGWDEWFACVQIDCDDPRFNNQSYVSTLNKKAIQRFIEETHEKYAEHFQDQFGKTIPAIFTDEPQYHVRGYKKNLGFATDKTDVALPYVDDLEETFVATYGYSFLDRLPELIWERKGLVSQIRYHFHDHVAERFAEAFADVIGNWCEEHNLMLTGHMMMETTLALQAEGVGEVMRSYRAFGLPGIDVLCDRRELATAKQAQSAAHQYGRAGVLSELYGVTNWDFDFRGHKLQGDWQAALGVTVRVHHLTWTTMLGEAKRDYPATIGYQSPWYQEYRYVEDYFARINTIMTRGQADVKIGVIHPIESYWIYDGTDEKTGMIRNEMDANFSRLLEWMLYGCLDFDFICESQLPKLNQIDEITKDVFPVGEMKYQVILVPNCVTLRSSTFERLKAFEEQGGTVIFTGETPCYLDAVYSEDVQGFVKRCKHIQFAKNSLYQALEDVRTVEVRNAEGLLAENMIYQMRNDGDNKLFFLAHVNVMKNSDLPQEEKLTIKIQGIYDVVCYNPIDGTKTHEKVTHKNGTTVIQKTMFDHDSLLLMLSPTESLQTDEIVIEDNNKCRIGETLVLDNSVKFKLEEPNVLVLDQAEYAFDHGEWQRREEILRIDKKFRETVEYPQRMKKFEQPWIHQGEPVAEHMLSMRFRVESEVELENVDLALENKTAELIWNGETVKNDIIGSYVDDDIFKVKLGKLQKGINELIAHIPFHKKENIECMYLLGEFGVRIQGAEAVVTQMPKTIAFGSIVSQGFPFYGGNIEYQIPIELRKDGILNVSVTRFRNPLLKVGIDDEQQEVIAYSPYQANLACTSGKHIVRLTAFGNRINTFGTLHNCDETECYFGQDTWRTVGDSWSYEYQLRPTGVLKMPVLTANYEKGR